MGARMSADVFDWLIVGRSNGYGLSHDLAIIADAIAVTGSTVARAGPWKRSLLDFLLRKKRARRILHVERAFPLWFSAADENWLLPNQERFPRRHVGRLQRIDRVLAKTHHAEAVFSALSRHVDYLGFISDDRLDQAEAKNWSRFFHVAGGSTLKGTEDVLALWAAHPEWPELVLVQKAANAPETVPPNVRLISDFLADAELKRLQNNCGIHLCPSRAEGWGHIILEAMSVEALVLTTDAAPMNEHITAATGILCPRGAPSRAISVCATMSTGSPWRLRSSGHWRCLRPTRHDWAWQQASAFCRSAMSSGRGCRCCSAATRTSSSRATPAAKAGCRRWAEGHTAEAENDLNSPGAVAPDTLVKLGALTPSSRRSCDRRRRPVSRALMRAFPSYR